MKFKGYQLFFSAIFFSGIILCKMPVQAQQQTIWAAPTTATEIKNPFADKKDATEKGKVLFNSTCSMCHGNTGKGDGIAGIAITPRPKNLCSDNVQTQTDGALFWKITTGNPPMASYKIPLTDMQRWALVNYIRQLKASDKK